MANPDIVSGLAPYGRIYQASPYVAGGTVYPGDPLKQKSDGSVEVAAATNALIGVAAHYATSGQKVLVYDHPAQKYSAQSDDATIAAQSDLGLNYNIIVASANTTYRRSGVEIDGDTGAVTGTLPLKVLALVPAADNAYGANCKVICKINNHQLGSHTGTDGV